MANYWAIAIGINQYQFFQPLRCAQADAEALKDFLVQQAGVLPQHCLLMTETSPPFANRPTYPTKENILLFLEDLAATAWQPQDKVWVFFSGYGVSHKGQDYLMPVEANPDRVEETGIDMRSLMQTLQMAVHDVLFLLDINRASGRQADAVGQETLQLAQELQIPTILSCQLEQFSQESTELGHGFFTAALLDALRSGRGSNLTDLDSYLRVLTPELCQHYWRPTQNPLSIIPPRREQILRQSGVRNYGTTSNWQESPISSEAKMFGGGLPDSSFQNDFPETSFVEIDTGVPYLGGENTLPRKAPPIGNSGEGETQEKYPSQPSQPHVSPLIPSRTNNFEQKKAPNSGFGKQLLFLGASSIMLLAVAAVVFSRDRTGNLKIYEILRTSPTNAAGETKVVKALPKGSSAPQSPAPPKSQPIAPIDPTNDLKKRNQALSDLTKMSLEPNQASDLNKAIANARKIKAGDPLYPQAQDNIKIWSRMILDLAEGRAKTKEYGSAIAAAQLITKDQPLHAKAQASINQWRLEGKQYMSNTTLLDAANGLISPGQASSYNRAIEVAKQVPQGQPGFDMAQKSINKWSEKILDIAKKRATQGDFKAAIETAVLVPEVSAPYEEAQEAIEKWRVRKIKN
jgi:Caspase domain